jgi:hypothetical protein
MKGKERKIKLETQKTAVIMLYAHKRPLITQKYESIPATASGINAYTFSPE